MKEIHKVSWILICCLLFSLFTRFPTLAENCDDFGCADQIGSINLISGSIKIVRNSESCFMSIEKKPEIPLCLNKGDYIHSFSNDSSDIDVEFELEGHGIINIRGNSFLRIGEFIISPLSRIELCHRQSQNDNMRIFLLHGMLNFQANENKRDISVCTPYAMIRGLNFSVKLSHKQLALDSRSDNIILNSKYLNSELALMNDQKTVLSFVLTSKEYSGYKEHYYEDDYLNTIFQLSNTLRNRIFEKAPSRQLFIPEVSF
jgi:hypothetical protein